jgi:predicted Rossmann-fold nucleotide-binding protein
MKHRIEDYSHDLTTPDGKITSLKRLSEVCAEAVVSISGISPWFVGFEIDPSLLLFNGKSVLAQLGINITGHEFELNKELGTAKVRVTIDAIGPIAREMLALLDCDAWIGKIFAKDDRRRVRSPDYVTRMFGRSDRWGSPLLSLGAMHGSDSLILDTVDGRAVAYLSLLNGKVGYDSTIFGFLPTLAKATDKRYQTRELLRLHQVWIENSPKNVSEGEILLVKTPPLHIRTVFAHVVDELLSPGYIHTTASILQPDTTASGDIYEFWGSSKREITDIPIEFYTLEPYREHVFYTDRFDLQRKLADSTSLLNAFETAPKPIDNRASVFVVKGRQLESLTPEDWISRDPVFNELPGISHGSRQAALVERFILQQSSYPFLRAIEKEHITSQGVLLCRFLPSPIMKRMLLSEEVSRCLKGIYFQHPSRSHGDFFSNEDRSLLNDLYKFGIPVYWVDNRTKQILQYIQKPQRETGMFVPLSQIDMYLRATVFGVYGSNLIAGAFEAELHELLSGILAMRETVSHPLLSKTTPLALVTGGGPGAMELANKISKELGILSCGNIADFRLKTGGAVNEQEQNPFVEAKMTYRLKELVERQAEFNLDFPIFVTGGIGTDFEFCLEEVRRKVGSIFPTPVLLFGDVEYWKGKITSRYQCNIHAGTNKGSEWVSGNLFCIQTAKQGLDVYRRFFEGKLPTGKDAKPQPLGFVTNIEDLYQ